MDLPASIFRPQQSWAPNVNQDINGNQRLVAYNYNNNQSDNLNENHFAQRQNQMQAYRMNDFDKSPSKISVAPSPTGKKAPPNKLGQWLTINQRSPLVSFKSNYGVEFRRYAVPREDIIKFEDFFNKVELMHVLFGTPFNIYYSDQDGEMLPINNDDQLAKAIDSSTRLKASHFRVANPINKSPHQTHQLYQQFQQQQLQQVIVERPYVKLFLERKGIPQDFYYLQAGSLKAKRKDKFKSKMNSNESRLPISQPENFRQVSSIIDAGILPDNVRRVVLKREGSDKPLGFYIHDGTYTRMNSIGEWEESYGIFISRLVPGGLAESTNLLAENDEILEVNGIKLKNEQGQTRRLNDVRDMMIANSSNLIITTRPFTQFGCSGYQRRMVRHRNNTNQIQARDRLPSSQSNHSDLFEDTIRHYPLTMNSHFYSNN